MSKHITGHTGLLCLLGSPVAHSVSPEMHNEACDQLGLDYTYLAFDVPEEKMPEAVQGLRTMGARGWNITMPGKNIMCKLADKVSPASEISGACNTIVNDNGVLTAYTTDGVGFMRAVAMKNLKTSNYITVDENGFINLTEAGQEIADKIYERHTFLTNWLTSRES